MTAPSDTDLEAAALNADGIANAGTGLAKAIRSWKAGTPTPAPAPTPSPTPDSKKWKLSVDDEFSGAKLDNGIWWAPYDGVPGTGGVGTRKGSLASLHNGQLIVAAERPSATSTNYDDWFSTGVAMGPKAQTFGRWEFSASVTDGPGFWPCIQLWPTDEKWPLHIELDIFESPFDGKRTRALATTHYTANNLQRSTEYDADFNVPHVWIVEWTPTAYVIYFDGKQVVNITDKTLIPTTPHHFVVQSDMGDWAGEPTSKDPTRIELALDYVKQWAYLG